MGWNQLGRPSREVRIQLKLVGWLISFPFTRQKNSWKEEQGIKTLESEMRVECLKSRNNQLNGQFN